MAEVSGPPQVHLLLSQMELPILGLCEMLCDLNSLNSVQSLQVARSPLVALVSFLQRKSPVPQLCKISCVLQFTVSAEHQVSFNPVWKLRFFPLWIMVFLSVLEHSQLLAIQRIHLSDCSEVTRKCLMPSPTLSCPQLSLLHSG